MADAIICKCNEVQPNIFASEIFLTVISGVLVFVLGQLFNEYWLKPIQKYKELRAKISYELTLYAYLYMNPTVYGKSNKEADAASDEIRKLAAEVDAMIELKPFCNFLIAPKSVLADVSKNLIGLSNGFYSNDVVRNVETNGKCRSEIYDLLNLKSHKAKKRRK